MAEIIKTYRERGPAMSFIGKKYPGFGGWWGEWFANGWFDVIERITLQCGTAAARIVCIRALQPNDNAASKRNTKRGITEIATLFYKINDSVLMPTPLGATSLRRVPQGVFFMFRKLENQLFQSKMKENFHTFIKKDLTI